MSGQMEQTEEVDLAATVVVPSALVSFAGGRSHIRVELTARSADT